MKIFRRRSMVLGTIFRLVHKNPSYSTPGVAAGRIRSRTIWLFPQNECNCFHKTELFWNSPWNSNMITTVWVLKSGLNSWIWSGILYPKNTKKNPAKFKSLKWVAVRWMTLFRFVARTGPTPDVTCATAQHSTLQHPPLKQHGFHIFQRFQDSNEVCAI
jgi:hypothetical protein